jgi:triacylglycerol lipase
VKILLERHLVENKYSDCVCDIMPSLTQILFLAAVPIIAVAVLWSPFSQDSQIPWSFSSNDPQVRLSQGLVIGTILDHKFPAPIEAFMGLPYSQPPIENRRFRRAVPLPASNDTIKAQKYGPMFAVPIRNF